MDSRFRSTLLAAIVLAGSVSVPVATPSLAQMASLVQPQQPVPARSPARAAWLKSRCSQLVAFFDRYGVSRGENSDGPRNHTRIGAVIECERVNYERGIRTMQVLLVNKAFDIPKPGTPEVEPQDILAPDITRPTEQRY